MISPVLAMVKKMSAPFGVATLCVVALMQCAERGGVVLELDFSTRPQWRYDMRVAVEGRMKQGGESRSFSSDAACLLTGRSVPDESSLLVVDLDSVSLSSSIFSPVEQENIRRQFEKTQVAFSWREGQVVPLDSVAFPRISVGEWDIYRTLARSIPSLPGGSVTVGASWEREKRMLLESATGDAAAYLYQVFTLDSVWSNAAGEPLALISWDFSYHIDYGVDDVAVQVDELPLQGEGRGSARLNTDRKLLEHASVRFWVPKEGCDSSVIGWSETVTLDLRDEADGESSEREVR